MKWDDLDNEDTTFRSRDNHQHWLDTVVYFLRSLKPGAHCVSQLQKICASRGRYPDNEHINKHIRSGVWQIWNFYQSSNTARCTGVKFQKFSSIYTQLEISILVCKNDYPVQGWNPTSIFFRKLNTVVHYIIKHYTKVQI